MWYKFCKWHSENNTQITWFLIGTLVLSGTANLVHGNWSSAAVCFLVAFANFKVRKL